MNQYNDDTDKHNAYRVTNSRIEYEIINLKATWYCKAFVQPICVGQ